jgi:uncharacterized cupredoxin-like copper-binding protein
MRAHVTGAATTLAAMAVLAACGSSSYGGSAAGGSSAAMPTSTSAPASGSAAAGKTVDVTATDFKFALPMTHLTPGTYNFVEKNAGQTTHAMEIDGPGVSDQKSSPVEPGSTTSLTVTLQKGTYEFYCPIDSHRAMGMQTTLTVG